MTGDGCTTTSVAPQQVSPPHASTHIHRVIPSTTNVKKVLCDDREHEAEETLIERRLDC